MVNTIANPSWLYVVVLVVIGIPGGIAIYFGAEAITISGSLVLVLLIGLLLGSIHQSADVDNITMTFTSLAIIAVLWLFLPLAIWHCGVTYLVGFLIGKELATKRTREIPGET